MNPEHSVYESFFKSAIFDKRDHSVMGAPSCVICLVAD